MESETALSPREIQKKRSKLETSLYLQQMERCPVLGGTVSKEQSSWSMCRCVCGPLSGGVEASRMYPVSFKVQRDTKNNMPHTLSIFALLSRET